MKIGSIFRQLIAIIFDYFWRQTHKIVLLFATPNTDSEKATRFCVIVEVSQHFYGIRGYHQHAVTYYSVEFVFILHGLLCVDDFESDVLFVAPLIKC